MKIKKNNSSFNKYKLNQLGYLSRGRSKHRPRNEPSLYGGNYPFIQTGDVKSANLYVHQFKKSYNEKGLKQSKLWSRNTLCITIAANIAETAILDFEACFPDSIIGFIANPKISDCRYIKYYIDFIKLNIQKISHGTTQDNLSMSKLLLFDFFVPNLNTQKKIGIFLSNYDFLIEKNIKKIKTLHELLLGLFKEWFVNFHFPGSENIKMFDTELGPAPEKWIVKKIGDVCLNLNSGGTPFRQNKNYWNEGTINWYKTRELWDNFLFSSEEKITELGLKNTSAKIFKEGTILMAIYGSPTVGRLGILTENSCFNQAAIGINANPNYVSQQFIFFVLFNLRDYFNKISTGAAQQNISKEKVYNTKFILPEKKLIEKFTFQAQAIWKHIKILQKKNMLLNSNRETFIKKIFSNKIDISNLDIKT